jgi:hypothetical protein
MRIQTTVDEARALVLSIPHKSCAKAADEHWKVSPDGTVRAQSVYWLYCWAKTGMNSEDARLVAISVFDQILPVRFTAFDAVVDHSSARELRYASGDIESKLDELLRQFP